MDGLSVAASVIAVVDISVKVINLCSKYATAVANARTDITRLETHLNGLNTTLEHAAGLIKAPGSQPLSASRDLIDQIQGCSATLQELEAKLDLGATRKVMRRVGFRALKWPFTREQMEVKIANLERYQRRIMDGLQIDQITLLLHIKNGVENLSLPANEDTSVAQKPHFMVPFPQDADFVSRPGIQTWIKEQDAGNTGRMALVGLGGFGKSQMTIEFAHQVHSSSPERSVFWVHGSTKATFEESYQSIADKLALPHRHDPKINTLALVRDYLQREDVAPWLMIVDNADDMNVFFAKAEVPIASYLPKTSNGNILITSRDLNVAERLTGSHKSIKKIPTMSGAEALQLFQNKLDSSLYDYAAASDLVHILNFIPLAVNQAAAYINRRRITIQSYIKRFQDGEKQKISLLNHDAGDVRRHESVSNSVALTWQMTFEQIRQERPAAANLLSLISFFRPQHIPLYMLSGYREATISLEEEKGESESMMLEDDLDVLLAYSLINPSEAPGFCEMHSLVQFCTQKWLSLSSDNLLHWKRLFLQLAARHFPSGAFETWDVCQILLPHIEMVLEEQPLDEADLLDWSLLLTNASSYMVMMGDYAKAGILAQKAVDVRKQLLGVGHSSTLRSMTDLASAYWNQGRWEETEKLQVQVLETRKIELGGVENPDTLSSMADLALTYWNQGRWSEAEKLQVQVMETRKTMLGIHHANTLTSMNNLALTYWNQGRLEQAEKLEVQVMEIRKTKLGADHPDTLTSMANLASTYRDQGQWDKAEELQIQAMETSKARLGPDHPSTLSSMANLALTYWNQGRWQEAEQLQTQVITARKVKLGPDHPNTLMSMANLVSTYWNQGRWDEAEKLSLYVMETRSTKLGVDHPDVLTSMADLALMYWNQGRWQETEALQVQVLETRKSKLGLEHPSTLMSMNNLAITLRGTNRLDEALALMLACASLRQGVLGPEHPHTKQSLEAMESWKQRQQGT